MLPSLHSLARERSLLAEVLRSAGSDRAVEAAAASVKEALLEEDAEASEEVGAQPTCAQSARQGEKRRRGRASVTVSGAGADTTVAGLQHLPKEVLSNIGGSFLDAPVWHACKLGEVSPQLGDVFMDDKLWEDFFHRRFSDASRSSKRRPQRQPSPNSRFSYRHMHVLEARFREGQYAARSVLDNPHPGVAVLDIQVAFTGDESAVAYAALRNGSIMGYDLDPAVLSGADAAPTSEGGDGPLCAKPLFELTPPASGGPALCCLPIPELLSVGDASTRSALLVAGYAQGGLCAWKMPQGCPLVPCGWEAAHAGRVSAVAMLGSGCLVSAASDGTMKVWGLDGERFGDLHRSFSGHTAAVVSVAACPFNENVVLSGSHDRTMRLWDARAGGGEVARWQQRDWVTCVDFHPTLEDRVLSADKAVHHWDVRVASSAAAPAGSSGGWLHLASCHRHRKLVSRFRLDPLRLASCSLDGSVKVSSLEAPGDRVASPLVSPEASPALSPAESPLPPSTVPEATLRTSTDYVLCIDFSATRLLAGSVDGRVDVYDFAHTEHFRQASPVLGPASPLWRRDSRCASTDFQMVGFEELEI